MLNSPITRFSADVVSLFACDPDQIRADAAMRRRAGLPVYIPGPFSRIDTRGKISLEWEAPASASEQPKVTIQASLKPGAVIPRYAVAFIAVTAGGESMLIGDPFHFPEVSTKRSLSGAGAEVCIVHSQIPLLVFV